MSTLNDNDVMRGFAKGASGVYTKWQKNTPVANQNEIKNLIRAAVRNTTVPPFEFDFLDIANGSGGFLDSPSWTLKINRAYTNRHDLPAYLFKWLCGILYHEARHGEQWFCCAQGVHEGDLNFPGGLSGVGSKNLQISTAFGNIPVRIVAAAENVGSYRLKSAAQKTQIAGWFNSVWGNQRGHRANVYAMPDLFTPGTAGNTAYVSLPEEVDAYATQNAVEAFVDARIAAAVQAAVPAAQPVAALKTQVTAAPAPTAPKAAIDTGAAEGVGAVKIKIGQTTAVVTERKVTPTVRSGTVQALAGLFEKV